MYLQEYVKRCLAGIITSSKMRPTLLPKVGTRESTTLGQNAKERLKTSKELFSQGFQAGRKPGTGKGDRPVKLIQEPKLR